MITRLTRLEGRQDQVVLFTLVELMTHLIFLALILGLALRKEADPVYQSLSAKCGVDGSLCEVKAPETPASDAGSGDDADKIMLASCRGEDRPLVAIRALGNGQFAIAPLADAPADLAGDPRLQPLMQAGTINRARLDAIGAPIRAAANSGAFGTACNITVRMCRAHGNASLWDQQRTRAWYYFQVVGQSACH